MKNMRFRMLGFWVLVVATSLAVAPTGAQAQSNAVVVKATRRAFVPPLSQMVPLPPRPEPISSLPDDDELRMYRKSSTTSAQDSVLQGSSDTAQFSVLSTLAAVPGLNILGQGTGFPGIVVNTNPSDPNLAVGPTQFVQFVNDSFTVFNKSDGSVAYGPAHGNTLWNALGGSCPASPNLDEIVQFDKLANRWVMLMAVFTAPNYFCLAVSTTSDAVNGGWNLYAFEEPGNNICHCRMQPDYPKLAVWPDGYYMAYNQGWNGNFEGAAACVLDRNSMLSNAAATMQCFNSISANFGTLLPADVDGFTAPPTGSPEYFLNFDYGNDQSLDLWQFHVDWTTPTNSTFTGPTNIPVAPFTEACGETVTELQYTTGACIPQAGTTQGLDSYGDRLMYRLAYRNFGTYQALVANHTVTVGTSSAQTGIRWYELQNTGAGFGLYQQGTYAPDSNYRWMGSIAMDKVGDIAMGYNVSSSSISPDIGYTGRMPSDPLGQMESETDVLSSGSIAHGSRTSNYHWADYSSISVDPTDDCTFWYTNEYMPPTGTNWSTRIASFSFPSCTGQSFTLTAAEIGQGTVTSTDGNINCKNGTGSCSAVYTAGSSVTLNAAPGSGWIFGGWSGACTGSNPCTVDMTSNLTATATFGQNVTLAVNEVGKGTVTSSDGQINCTNGSGTCSAVYVSGTSVTLNATAGSGFTFSGWSGPCSGRTSCNLTMNTNLTVTSTFVTSPSWTIVHRTSRGGAITNLTIPATLKGDSIAVALMFNGTTSVSSISDNAGNTYVSAGAGVATGPFSVEIWYAQNLVAGATLITPTFAGTEPTNVEITTWELSGALSLPPSAVNTATGTLTLTNTPGPAVTTPEAGDFIISVILGINTTVSGISTGNEFTNDFKTNGNGWAHITSNAAIAGTHQASWSIPAPTGKYCASTVAFAP